MLRIRHGITPDQPPKTLKGCADPAAVHPLRPHTGGVGVDMPGSG